MKLTARRLLKSVATKDAPLARGFGKLSMYYRLNGRDEDAGLIEALFTLYQRQSQQDMQMPFSEFDKRIRQRRSSSHGNHLHGFQE
jgi:hypothetical protein